MDKSIQETDRGEKEARAKEIFSELQSYKGRASMGGYFSGEVIFTNQPPRRIEVYRLPVTDDFEEDLVKKRGFTDEDIQSGMITIIEKEFNNPQWPKGKFIQEKQLRYFNVSGKGRVVVDYYPDHDKFEETKLDQNHLDALTAVFRLSLIPNEIIAEFGTYDNFVKLLGSDYDSKGIDNAEFTPTGILYNGGLRAFVNALAKRKDGQKVKLDSHLHELQASLDDRSHFEQMMDILQRGNEK